MSRHVERLDLRDHDGFERCVGYKATAFRALHLFLRGCERQLVNPVIALAIAHPAEVRADVRTALAASGAGEAPFDVEQPDVVGPAVCTVDGAQSQDRFAKVH
jgi:hypothetical protein